MTNPLIWALQDAKTEISLRMCPVRSVYAVLLLNSEKQLRRGMRKPAFSICENRRRLAVQ